VLEMVWLIAAAVRGVPAHFNVGDPVWRAAYLMGGVGSLVLVGLPELLREFGEFRLHIYGAILVAIMLIKPEGLIPDKRRALELRGDDHQPEKAVLSASETEGVQ